MDGFWWLVAANSMHWHGNILKTEHGHVLRHELELEVEGGRNKVIPK